MRNLYQLVISCEVQWRWSVSLCRSFRGADLGNADHRLVVAKICLKLKFQKVNKHINAKSPQS